MNKKGLKDINKYDLITIAKMLMEGYNKAEITKRLGLKEKTVYNGLYKINENIIKILIKDGYSNHAICVGLGIDFSKVTEMYNKMLKSGEITKEERKNLIAKRQEEYSAEKNIITLYIQGKDIVKIAEEMEVKESFVVEIIRAYHNIDDILLKIEENPSQLSKIAREYNLNGVKNLKKFVISYSEDWKEQEKNNANLLDTKIIYKLFKKGYNFEEIGKICGFSKEHVEKIFFDRCMQQKLITKQEYKKSRDERVKNSQSPSKTIIKRLGLVYKLYKKEKGPDLKNAKFSHVKEK